MTCILGTRQDITFDQPLYWKAAEIIQNSASGSELKSIVLLLGCFHTFMNVLGTIGILMNGTGLKEILGVIYGENAITHMMTGKSVQRAFRGHLLVDKCLSHMILSEMLNDDPQLAAVVAASEEMYTELSMGDIELETVLTSETLIQVSNELEKRKMDLGSNSQTSKLWLNYQRMVKVARTLIMAERTGSWLMHLHAVSDCLPIFATAGHFNYLKSAYLYVQEMGQLHETNPDVYRKFENGLHVVRRSNQSWAGLSSDLVIEQTLMRSLKTTGGLTHGSGMSEEQRALWTLSSPISAAEQHKDLTEARMKRDLDDFKKIQSKLVACTPFSSDPSLRNIVTGVVAQEGVNVHEYDSSKMMQKMIGQPVFTISFSRKDNNPWRNISNQGCS